MKQINIIKLDGGFICAKPGYNEENDTYHVWLILSMNSNDILLNCSFDDKSFKANINEWIVTYSQLNPVRINDITFQEIICR